jgi:hypothetical protein
MISTGRGTRKISGLETQIRFHYGELSETSNDPPEAVLLGGVIAEGHQTASPDDIVTGDVAEDLLTGPKPRRIVANDPTAMEALAEVFDAA